MWTCPKWGREFKRTNQSHYCGKAPESVDEYIELQIPEARAYVVELRNIIRRFSFVFLIFYYIFPMSIGF